MSATALLNAALAGRYTIERELGRGGMATVYLARDLRHERRVALKVLLPELGVVLGPERFLAEIRVTAALQHPHLLPLFDSGEVDGRLFYVMPYVEGESLRARLDREQQLPVDEAIRIGVAIASALDYAHRRGVIHRDLKPENVLLADGEPLVADFGIALAISHAGGERITQTGLSLGTPAYMSPEQATGDRHVDGRSDIYSLGAVVYEMLVGEPPHTGATAQAVIARVLTERPRSVRSVRDAVPDYVDAAIARALAKLPADRFATAQQFADALQGRVGGALAAGGVPRGRRSAGLRAVLPWGVALLALAVAAWASARPGAAPDPASTVRFTLPLPSAERMQSGAIAPVAIAPNGRSIAYVGRSAAGRRMLYVRPLGELRATPLPATEGDPFGPFFSPDGRWVAFVDGSEPQNTLKKVPAAGGEVTTIARAPEGTVIFSGAWGPNDDVVVGSTRGLLRVPAAGGTLKHLTTRDSTRGENGHGAPRFLPGGGSVVYGIFTSTDHPEQWRLGVASVNGPAQTTLDVSGLIPLGLVGGWLVYGRGGGTLAAVPFDASKRRVTGEPVPVLTEVLSQDWGSVVASLADNGTLIYGRGSELRRLALVDERGNVEPGGLDERRSYASPRLSPDGRRVAVEVSSPSSSSTTEVWIYDLGARVLSRLTSQAPAFQPAWTADGRRIVYISERNHRRELWWAPADGSGQEERLFALPDSETIGAMTVAPDGQYAVLVRYGRETQGDLWLLPLGADAAGSGRRSAAPLGPTPLLQTRFHEHSPRVSPDGRRLAYVSAETGQSEVYVRPFPGPGGRIQVSSGGGTEPVWAPDGRRLFYRGGGRLIAATIAPSPALAAGRRDTLFEDRFRAYQYYPQYDVLPDGKGFVLLQPAEDDQEIVVAVGWGAELQTRLSAAR